MSLLWACLYKSLSKWNTAITALFYIDSAFLSLGVLTLLHALLSDFKIFICQTKRAFCVRQAWIVTTGAFGTNESNLSTSDTFQSWHSLSRTWTELAVLSLWPDTIGWSDSWILHLFMRWTNNMVLSSCSCTDRLPSWKHTRAKIKKSHSHVYSILTDTSVSFLDSSMRNITYHVRDEEEMLSLALTSFLFLIQ